MRRSPRRQFQRREMLRVVGALGAGLALGPAMALAAASEQRDELVKSRAVLSGKAGKFTILHTADIHAQLNTHDEFFYENRWPSTGGAVDLACSRP